MKLYEIAEEFARLDEFALETDDDVKAFGDLYNMLKATLTEKVENVCFIIANNNSDIDALSVEIKRLQAKKKSAENKIDSLKEYIQHELECIGLDSIKTPLFSVKVQDNPPKVIGDDVSLLPKTMVTLIPEQIVPIKAEISSFLKSGGQIEGWTLVQTRSIRIR